MAGFASFHPSHGLFVPEFARFCSLALEAVDQNQLGLTIAFRKLFEEVKNWQLEFLLPAKNPALFDRDQRPTNSTEFDWTYISTDRPIGQVLFPFSFSQLFFDFTTGILSHSNAVSFFLSVSRGTLCAIRVGTWRSQPEKSGGYCQVAS